MLSFKARCSFSITKRLTGGSANTASLMDSILFQYLMIEIFSSLAHQLHAVGIRVLTVLVLQLLLPLITLALLASTFSAPTYKPPDPL